MSYPTCLFTFNHFCVWRPVWAHHKGPVATTPQPTRLPCVGCDASSISQTSVKAKDHPRIKKYTAADLGWIATDNDQQSYQRLSQTLLGTCVSADGWRFEHIWTKWSRLIWHNFVRIRHTHIHIRLIITYDMPHIGTMIYAVTLRKVLSRYRKITWFSHRNWSVFV